MKRVPRSAFHLFTDGASRGNPGPSGVGAALHTPHGRLRAALSSFVGPSTCNVAEYRACVQGLRLARALDVARVVVFSDSQLLVRQMQRKYTVRNRRLKRFHTLLRDVSHQFEECRFTYVAREENRMADRLANQALDLRRRNYVVLYQEGDDLPSHAVPHGYEVEYAPAPNRQLKMP